MGARLYGPTPHPWTWEPALPYFNLWILLQGNGRLHLEKRDYHLKPGTCFLFAPGMRISGRSTSHEPFLNFSIHFFPVPTRKIAPGILRKFRGHRVRRMSFLMELARHCDEVWKRGDALGQQQTRIAALQILLLLWREIVTPPPKDDEEKIRSGLAEAANRTSSSVPQLAKSVGLSTSQFTRRVRAITGMPPREYLIRERINRACSLLGETSRSITEIAGLLGYNDPSYFIRQFQHVMKTTPANFRRER